MTKNKEQVYVILGLTTTGLMLLRELTRARVKVYAIGQKNDLGLYSKYGVKYECLNIEDIRVTLENIKSKHIDIKPKLFITNNFYIDVVLNELPQIYDDFNVIGPNIDYLEILLSKTKSKELLLEHGFRQLEVYNHKNFDKITQYPVIVKWDEYRDVTFQNKYITKTKIIYNEKELTNYLDLVSDYDESILKELIIQIYLDSNKYKQYAYGSYYINGNKVMSITIDQKRQYPKGITSYGIESRKTHLKKVENKIDLFLTNIEMNGFIEFEYLINIETEEYYIIDINPRTWGTTKILKSKYINFKQLLVASNNVPRMRKRRAVFIKGFQDLMNIFSKHEFPFLINIFLKILSLFRTNKVRDLFDLRDLKPMTRGIVTRYKRGRL